MLNRTLNGGTGYPKSRTVLWKTGRLATLNIIENILLLTSCTIGTVGGGTNLGIFDWELTDVGVTGDGSSRAVSETVEFL